MPSRKFEDMIDQDIILMSRIEDYCKKTPWIESFYSKAISKHPWNDVCLVIWVVFAFGLMEYGKRHFWVVAMNLFVCYVLQQLIAAKRPVEYDRSLQPIADVQADSYGFPSIESYMSVVITGHIFFLSKSVIFLPFALFIVVGVGVSRVYAKSRFPHQILGSWILGFFGLLLSMHCCERMGFLTMHAHAHGSCFGIAMLALVVVFALSMENNDSRLLYIPKKEFLKVILGIMGSSGPSSTVQVDDDEEQEEPLKNKQRDFSTDTNAIFLEKHKTLGSTPRSAALRRVLESASATRRRPAVKRDSFYFLQRTLEKRDEEIQRKKSGYYDGGIRSSPRHSARGDFSDGEYIGGNQT